MKYTKDMTISKILFNNSRTIEIFHKYNLDCLKCLGAEKETLEEVARVNNLDVNKMIEDLNNIDIEEKKNACD